MSEPTVSSTPLSPTTETEAGTTTSEAPQPGSEPSEEFAPAMDNATPSDPTSVVRSETGSERPTDDHNDDTPSEPELATETVGAAETSDGTAPTTTPAASSPVETPAPARPSAFPSPALLARSGAPSPAQLAGRLVPATPGVRSSQFGRVSDDGTVYVITPEGEIEVGSYPGATPEEALAYFTRKYVEADAQADLLLQRVTQTGLSAKEAADGLAKLREATKDLRAVGDLVALAAKVENVATAVEARRQVDAAERAEAREVGKARRTEIVEAAEHIAAQPEEKIQWKASSSQMRQFLEDWKTAQREGPKLDRETEQALWHRLSGARNSFDKMRRVHFAQLGSAQANAKATKEELVVEAEQLSTNTEWGLTAGAFKRLMDRWRQAGRASRADDDALWLRFKAAQDTFFAAKDQVVAAENEEFTVNLKVKEELLEQAKALLPIKDLDSTKAALRKIQDRWDAAGKVPRPDLERIEKGMRRVEAALREADDRKWVKSNPEVAARAQSLVTQLEAACEGLRADLSKAETSGNATKIAKAGEALEARESWLEQARSGLAEFSR